MDENNNLSIISNEIVKKKISDFFSEKLKSKNIRLVVENGSKNGDNFMGLIYRVSGTNDENNERASIIVKMASSNPVTRKWFFSRPAFICEIFTYSKVCRKILFDLSTY